MKHFDVKTTRCRSPGDKQSWQQYVHDSKSLSMPKFSVSTLILPNAGFSFVGSFRILCRTGSTAVGKNSDDRAEK